MVVISLVKVMVYRVSLVTLDSLGTSRVMVSSLVKVKVMVEARKDYKLRYWWNNNNDDVKSTSVGGGRWRH
jgi:hypothetical protein